MKRQSTDLFKRRWVCDVDGITEAGVAHGVCAPNRVDGQREKAKDKPLTMHLACRKAKRKNCHNPHGYEKGKEPLSLQSG